MRNLAELRHIETASRHLEVGRLALQIGEDAAFVAEAWRAGQLVTADAGEIMHATIHPDNTSRRVIGEGWTEMSEVAAA